MKTIAIISLLSLSAVGAYAQGYINFLNDAAGKLVTEIYAPNPINPLVQTTGNQTTDTPAGTTSYAGFTPIGGSSGPAGSSVNYANGNNFSVSLYALGEDDANGDGGINPLYKGTSTLFSSLLPVTTYNSTMSQNSSALAAGFFVFNNPSPDPGIPNAGYNAVNGTIDNVAALAVVAWYNNGGTITSFAQAKATPGAMGVWGASPVFALSNLGEPGSVESNVGAGPTPAPDMIGTTTVGHYLQTFSLVTNIPEPSTIALGVMGVFGFLARRRKK